MFRLGVPGDLVDGHHPGGPGVVQPDAGPDGPAGIPVDHGHRQPAARGVGGGGHVEQLEPAEVGHPVAALAWAVPVGVRARLGKVSTATGRLAAAISWNG